MATLKIDPITTTTIGGLDVFITGLRPQDDACIIGDLSPVGAPVYTTSWNLAGMHTNGVPASGLDMSPDEMQELVALARKLGVSR